MSKHPADSQNISCVGFDGMNFTIQVEVKAILRIVLNHFSMMRGGFVFFFTLSAFMCFLTFALTNNSQ